MTRILLAGETWIMHTIHQKGFDHFTTTAYGEGHQWLTSALNAGGYQVDLVPNHLAATDFPGTVEDIEHYGAIILSDIGANTLLLHPDTFERSQASPNRLMEIRDYVNRGGGLVMVGGYLSFQGIDAKARYANTPVEEALPVTISPFDDRVEAPQGIEPRVTESDHQVVAGLPDRWPNILGYNRVTAKPDSTTVARIGNDPLVTLHKHGNGRSIVFTSDCGPHWAPPEFVEWEGYTRLWTQIIGWVTGVD